jgi:hypothetical protein
MSFGARISTQIREGVSLFKIAFARIFRAGGSVVRLATLVGHANLLK